MMKRIVLAAGALLCLRALPTQAADLKDLPSETKWVLSLDMKAAQAAPMLTFIIDKIAPAKRQEAQTKLAAIKALFGVDLLNDIDQLVIAGNGNADMGGVAYVYGTFDVQRLSTILAGSKDFTTAPHGGFTVLGWNDDKQKYISFAKPGLAMLSSSQTSLTDALDVLDGNKKGLAPDSTFKSALSRPSQGLLTVQAVDVPSIVGEQPKAQALKQAQALRLCVSASQPDALSAELSVTTASDDTALQIQQALMGIQALAMLRAGEAPEQATLASLAKISNQGRTVGVTLTLSKSVVETFVRQREAKQAAKDTAAAAPIQAITPAAKN